MPSAWTMLLFYNFSPIKGLLTFSKTGDLGWEMAPWGCPVPMEKPHSAVCVCNPSRRKADPRRAASGSVRSSVLEHKGQSSRARHPTSTSGLYACVLNNTRAHTCTHHRHTCSPPPLPTTVKQYLPRLASVASSTRKLHSNIIYEMGLDTVIGFLNVFFS